MLTPRRSLLLLAGFALFICAYLGYAQILGWLDGLPQLPAKMLVENTGDFRPPETADSPTKVKLAEAFGPKCPEIDYALYETQLEFRNGESSIVLAAGPVPPASNSTRVTLSPFSLAVFGKPKPRHLRQPGEVTEISTVHADKAVLEFDRIIGNPNDMRTAKLVRLELVSDIEQTFPDPRRGTVEITNNQRSPDRNMFLVVHTPGPVFYRDAKAVIGTPAAQGPDFWTDAPVEIVDRQNVPRAVGAGAPAVAGYRSEELRSPAVVGEILAGRRPAPPTVAAVGLRIYLEPDPPPGQPKPKKAEGGLHGLRRVEFLEQVAVNLWVDNGQSVGGPPPPGTTPAEPQARALALTPPPAAVAGAAGNLATAAYAVRLTSRALLQIDTRGPFAYDADKALARFDVVPHSDPNLPNDVQVTKVPAAGGTSSLFSQVLELEFNGGATAGARAAGGAPAIKRLHAWTSTPGRFVTAAGQDEAMEAYGQDLVHDQAAGRMVLTGAPLYVVRDRNVLSAGAPQRPATLTTEPGPAPARRSQLTVRGAGRVELYDAAAEAVSVVASWQTSLVQSKETVDGRELDLFVFTDGAEFKDVRADYWLRGNVLKLWLEGPPGADPKGADPNAADAAPRGQPRPSRLQAVGNVKGHSADFDVKQANQLNVFFADAKPAVAAGPRPPVSPQPAPAGAAGKPPAAGPPAPAPAPTAVAGGPPPPPKEPEKPKPPLLVEAKDIQTWVTRTPVAPGAAPAPAKPPAPGQPAPAPAPAVKYQLDRAVCDEDVTVHQDPTDPTKPRGLDIFGRWLRIDGSPDGNVLTVLGWPTKPGEIHQEETSLIGPEIVLNQVLNAASVKGRGALTMPTGSDLAGGELAQPDVVVIHWRDEMEFKGAQRSAKFVGKVSARQGESWVLCHTLHAVFDRPVYFNQVQKKAAPPPPPKAPPPPKPGDPKAAAADDKPKIDKVFCYPAPADSADDPRELAVYFNQVDLDKAGKVAKSQYLEALELRMFARAQDESGERYQRVEADGPGTVRIWQPGDKDAAGPRTLPAAPPPAPGAPLRPAAPPPPAGARPVEEQEMKLTVVKFNRQMVAVDKGKVFQKATFDTNVKVVHVPADSPTLEVVENRLPPRAVLLTCSKELVVWTHKKGTAPPVQRMDATGNAYLRSDDYDGWGETVSNDGKMVILTGGDAVPARIMTRFNGGSDQSGEKIIYDRETGRYQVVKSFGGPIGGGPKK